MRKSSTGGGRLSMSGAPLRVINENSERQRSSSGERASLHLPFAGGRKSVLNPHRGSGVGAGYQGTSISKPGRPSTGMGAWGRSDSVKDKRASSDKRGSGSSGSQGFSIFPKDSRSDKRLSSNIGVRGRTDIQKDPRPVTDKRYQANCLKQLLEYLVSNSYPHQISQKMLATPSSKDFFKIFEFINGKFTPNYKQVPKMEEEVPRVLRQLGYPVAVSKTYLFSVGSPHTWPYLLAALIWMIDLLRMIDSLDDYGGAETFIFEKPDEDFEGFSDDRIVFENCTKGYKLFMSGEDNIDALNEELEQILKQKYQGANIDEIKAENIRLEEELPMLQKTDEEIKRLEEHIEISKRDQKSFRDYIDKMKQHKKSLLAELQLQNDQRQLLRAELEAEQEKLLHMQEVYQRQDLTPGDVERMRAEQDGLKQQVENLEKQTASIDADIWQISMEQAKLNEKVEMEVATYNKLSIGLKLVPETTDLANGRDFRLRSGANADIVSDFENKIKPQLLNMKKACANSIRQKNKEKFQMMFEIEQIQEVVNEKKEQIAVKAKDLALIEAEIESMKQMLYTEKKTEERSTLKQEMLRLEALVKQKEEERDMENDKTQACFKLFCEKKEEVDQKVKALEKESDMMMESARNYINGIKEGLMSNIQQLGDMNKGLDQMLSEIDKESNNTKEWLKSHNLL